MVQLIVEDGLQSYFTIMVFKWGSYAIGNANGQRLYQNKSFVVEPSASPIPVKPSAKGVTVHRNCICVREMVAWL